MEQHFIAFVLFVIAMTGTPGPGNLSMMAIGQATGFRSALPFLAGTVIGCFVLDTSVVFGLGQFVIGSEVARQVLRVAGTAYILYLAVKVLRAHTAPPDKIRPFTFREGLLLHPLSPKSWAMAVAAVGQFVDPNAPLMGEAVVFVAAFLCGAIVFHSLWGLAGAGISHVFQRPGVLACINAGMVVLMVGATMYALFV